jgi:GH15 family glucan-1,4-alpha-glucosidase
VTRLEDYALIGDLQTAALVGRDGAVDWLCLPHFDSPACFAALLDAEGAGRWLLAPSSGGSSTRRRYRGDTLVLETEWSTPDGEVRVIDFMPPRHHHPRLVRIVEGVTGAVPMRGELTLRFDYGKVVPWVRHRGTRMSAVAGPDATWLTSTVPLRGRDWTTVAEFTVRPGDRVPFVLCHAPSHVPEPTDRDAEAELVGTLAFWTEWSGRARVPAAYRDAVMRSLITLKALTFAPTGGIVAAPTTSLPEWIGGARNWDYRFCWLRDATLTLQALLAAGYVDEAGAWRDWLLRAVAGDPAELQIMYGIDGRRRLPEAELSWLGGYEGSAPVRIGNAAADQRQLDVWGEVLDGLALARAAGLAADLDSLNLQLALVRHLEQIWQEPDDGLWEMRGPRRHFTHSKVMAWVGVDRMVTVMRRHDLPQLAHWEELRDRIHADVLAHGYDADRGTFTQCYGSPALDASLLLIGRVGFLPPTDPRVVGTVKAVQQELTEGGFVLRYRTEDSGDGLPAGEGVFLACSFWLVDALHGAGRHAEATELFERLLALRNDVGLLSEQWDPRAGRQLGNTPQAFSHFPLIVSAVELASGRTHRSDSAITTVPDRG